MEIKTKLSIGDKAFFLNKNSVVDQVVDFIVINASCEGVSIRYYFGKASDPIQRDESEVFATKADLLASL